MTDSDALTVPQGYQLPTETRERLEAMEDTMLLEDLTLPVVPDPGPWRR